MTSLNEIEKKNYIKNNFHQYFDLTLNENIETSETINLIVPVSQLKNENQITNILNKYDDVSFSEDDLVECIFVRVIDGDTIVVKIPEESETDTVTIRLSGINTPEVGEPGYDAAKEFLENICYENQLYLKIDSVNRYDVYKRTLAVLVCQNKNINQVLLGEEYAEIMYVPPTEFDPYEWRTISSRVYIEEVPNSDISILSPYFNPDMTNVVFTPKNDLNTIYKYEIYKGVYYIKLQPFSQEIRMHLLPKAYDCSNSVLIFKDNMLTENNISKSNDYYFYQGENINSYYLTDIENKIIRDRTNPDISEEEYNFNDWSNTFFEASYDISKYTNGLDKIQICSKYKYNISSPFYSIHFTGIRDNTNIYPEDRCTLIDVNYDKIENISNNITQYQYDNQNQLYLPRTNSRIIKSSYTDNINHTDISKSHQKIIKYINDILYSEEDVLGTSENKKRYAVANWTEDI